GFARRDRERVPKHPKRPGGGVMPGENTPRRDGDDYVDRFLELLTFLGEVPTEVLAKKARALLPELVDSPVERAHFREMLRGVAMCRRSGAVVDQRTAEAIADEVNSLREAGWRVTIDGDVVGIKLPESDLPPEAALPPKTAADLLSDS